MASELESEAANTITQQEVSCVVAALHSAVLEFGTLRDLPGGALHQVGGLTPGTASMVESLIREVAAQETTAPTPARVMAELDARGRILE